MPGGDHSPAIQPRAEGLTAELVQRESEVGGAHGLLVRHEGHRAHGVARNFAEAARVRGDPAIGELDLDFEALEMAGDDTLTVLTYSARPGTPSGDGLELLASWAATQETVTAPSRD